MNAEKMRKLSMELIPHMEEIQKILIKHDCIHNGYARIYFGTDDFMRLEGSELCDWELMHYKWGEWEMKTEYSEKIYEGRNNND